MKQYSQNVYQMAIVQPGFGFICEAGGGKSIVGRTFEPTQLKYVRYNYLPGFGVK